MLTTVFKDKVPKGMSYPFPLGVLQDAFPGAPEQAVALYFVHGSHWNDHAIRERLHMPLALLAAGRTRPMFRNNNQKVAAVVDDCEWHVVLWAMPSIQRHLLRREFTEKAAEPLRCWLVDRQPRSTGAYLWWHPESQTIQVDFQ
jgi:hypothetical protein